MNYYRRIADTSLILIYISFEFYLIIFYLCILYTKRLFMHKLYSWKYSYYFFGVLNFVDKILLSWMNLAKDDFVPLFITLNNMILFRFL